MHVTVLLVKKIFSIWAYVLTVTCHLLHSIEQVEMKSYISRTASPEKSNSFVTLSSSKCVIKLGKPRQ